MNRTIQFSLGICCVILLNLVSFCVGSDNMPVPTETKIYVDILATATVKEMAIGAKGEISVSLVPREGVALNKIPPLEITVEQPKQLKLEKKQASLPTKKEMDKLEELYFEKMMDPKADMSEFYFPALKPFIFPFTLTETPSSALKIKIHVLYTYCTVKDGFCMQKEANLEIPLKKAQSGKTGDAGK